MKNCIKKLELGKVYIFDYTLFTKSLLSNRSIHTTYFTASKGFKTTVYNHFPEIIKKSLKVSGLTRTVGCLDSGRKLIYLGEVPRKPQLDAFNREGYYLPRPIDFGVFMEQGTMGELLIIPTGFSGLQEVKVPNKRLAKGFVYSVFTDREIPLANACRFINSWIDTDSNRNKILLKTKDYYELKSMSAIKDFISGKDILKDNSICFFDKVVYKEEDGKTLDLVQVKYSQCVPNNLIEAMDRYVDHQGRGYAVYATDDILKADPKIAFNSAFGFYHSKYTPLANVIRPKAYSPFNNLVPKIITESSIKKIPEIVKSINCEYGTDSATNLITEQKPYTFGVEIETSGGNVSYSEVVKQAVNVKCVRDGSIQGGEYVTGVLSGDRGFMNLKKLTNLLSKSCKVDTTCGVHVHLGNFSFTKEHSIYIYLLGLMLEDELFDMMPYSRRENRFCSKLKSDVLSASEIIELCSSTQTKEERDAFINAVYKKLHDYLLYSGTPVQRNTSEPSYANVRDRSGQLHRVAVTPSSSKRHRTHLRKVAHPGGHYAGGQGSARYNWLNMIPCNFKQKSPFIYALGDPECEGGSLYKIQLRKDYAKEIIDLFRTRDLKLIDKTEGEELSVLKHTIERNSIYATKRFGSVLDSQLLSCNRPDTRVNVSSQDLGSYTIEFRVHSATLSYTKISNWVLICMAFLAFIENRSFILTDAILKGNKLSIKDILFRTYSVKQANYLSQYVEERKRLFKLSEEKEEKQKVKDADSASVKEMINNLKNECVL